MYYIIGKENTCIPCWTRKDVSNAVNLHYPSKALTPDTMTVIRVRDKRIFEEVGSAAALAAEDENEEATVHAYLMRKIKWDTDGERIPGLPTRNLMVFAEDEDEAVDALCDEYSFCIFGVDMDEMQEGEYSFYTCTCSDGKEERNYPIITNHLPALPEILSALEAQVFKDGIEDGIRVTAIEEITTEQAFELYGLHAPLVFRMGNCKQNGKR